MWNEVANVQIDNFPRLTLVIVTLTGATVPSIVYLAKCTVHTEGDSG